MIEVQVDPKVLDKAAALLKHIPGGMKKAQTRTLRRVMNKVKTRFKEKAAQEYYAKPGEISKSQSIRISGTQGIMKSRGSKLSLADYYLSPKTAKAANKAGGIKAAVRRDGIKGIKGAFLIKLGHQGKIYPYIRVGRRRWDIKRLMSPAYPQIIGNERIVNELTPKILEDFEERLKHEIMFELGAFTR